MAADLGQFWGQGIQVSLRQQKAHLQLAITNRAMKKTWWVIVGLTRCGCLQLMGIGNQHASTRHPTRELVIASLLHLCLIAAIERSYLVARAHFHRSWT